MKIATRNAALTPILAAALCGPALAGSLPHLQDFEGGGQITGKFVATQTSTAPVRIGAANVFDVIRGRIIVFTIAFDAIDHEDIAPEDDGGQRRILTTSPVRIAFLGDPTGYLQQVIAPTLNCPVRIEIHEDAAGTVLWEGFEISRGQTPQYFSFKCGNQLTQGGRAPSVQSVGLDTETMVMQRFDTAPAMIDLATGPARYSIIGNVAVGVAPRTFGEVKSLYRSQQ